MALFVEFEEAGEDFVVLERDWKGIVLEAVSWRILKIILQRRTEEPCPCFVNATLDVCERSIFTKWKNKSLFVEYDICRQKSRSKSITDASDGNDTV